MESCCHRSGGAQALENRLPATVRGPDTMPFLMGCGEHPGLNARPLQVSAASTRCTGSRNSRLVSSIITSDHVLGGHGAADEPPCFHEARPALTTLLVFLLLAPPQPQRCFGVMGGSAGDLKTNVQVQFRKEKDACGLLPRTKACKKVTWVKGAAPQGAGLHLGVPRAPCPHHEPACRTGDHSCPAYTPASCSRFRRCPGDSISSALCSRPLLPPRSPPLRREHEKGSEVCRKSRRVISSSSHS